MRISINGDWANLIFGTCLFWRVYQHPIDNEGWPSFYLDENSADIEAAQADREQQATREEPQRQSYASPALDCECSHQMRNKNEERHTKGKECDRESHDHYEFQWFVGKSDNDIHCQPYKPSEIVA